jgi:arylsulfatase A-like enzyme
VARRTLTATRRELLVRAALAAGAVALPAGSASAQARRVRPEHVVLVDWDGFGSGLLDRAPMPNLQSLSARGSLSVAESTYNTYSNSARASMSTGAYPEVHGNAGYYLDRERDVVVGQNRDLRAQTINQALAGAGRTTASVGWYMVENFGTTYGDPEQLYVQPGVAPRHQGQPGAAFATRVDVAIDILNRRPVDSAGESVTVPRIPAFLAVYAAEIDALQHEQGPASPSLPALLAAYDRDLGRLVQGVRDAGIAERTAVLVTADHGFSAWTRTVMPALVEAIGSGGMRAEVVAVDHAPAADTEVVLISNGVRMSNVYLRGRAAGDEGRAIVRAAADRVGHIPNVFDLGDLRRLHASDKLGDMALEAEPPYHFSLVDDGTERGAHGSTFEMSVPLVLAGASVRSRGRGVHRASLVDVAPTIAALLGTAPPAQAQGRALHALMDESYGRSRGAADSGDMTSRSRPMV